MNKLIVLVAAAMTVAAVVLAAAIRHAWGARVDSGGHRVRMLIRGTAQPGDPTIVMEAGLGSPLEVWAKVQPQVARFARVVSYDRANNVASEAGPLPRDANHIADELRVALKHAGIAPPYILVGHSLGGPLVRVFAHRYPSDMAGLILVEPTQEQVFDRSTFRVGDEDRSSNSELVWVPETLEQAKAADPLPPVPVAVITGARDIDDPTSRAFRPDVLAARVQWVESMPNAKHILAHKSYHLPQHDEPDVVVQTIRQIFEAAQRTRR